MKKIFTITFMFIGVLLLTACGSENIDVNKTKTDKYNKLSYVVPEKFEKEKNDYESEIDGSSLVFSDYHYTYKNMASNGKFDDMCSLGFFYDKSSYNDTLEEYAQIYHEGKTGTKKTINGVEWYIVKEQTSEKMVDYYYYSKYGNNYYEVSYNDWGKGNICGDALETIEKSLKFEN